MLFTPSYFYIKIFRGLSLRIYKIGIRVESSTVRIPAAKKNKII